jgi:hypothetical protein
MASMPTAYLNTRFVIPTTGMDMQLLYALLAHPEPVERAFWPALRFLYTTALAAEVRGPYQGMASAIPLSPD